jgi:glycosyltransferase involved in cell wall biosynthesis
VEVATKAGAKVVPVAARGYGAALMGGIAAAEGDWIVMGDADDSYDFGEIPKFVAKMSEGFDLVQGCRLPSGGGKVAPGAMPWSHRWIGNPLFSFLARYWFKAPIHDVYCGMRSFRKDFYLSLDQQCIGMEFATEMIIKASLRRARLAEVPITLHKDGRIVHPPHLKTFRDGWRTLRFYLLFCPRWLFLIPGLGLMGTGVVCYCLGLPGIKIGTIVFDVHTLLYGTVLLIAGYQAVLFAVMTKTFAINHRLLPFDPRFDRWFRCLNLETGAVLGLLTLMAGVGLLVYGAWTWGVSGFGAMDYPRTLRIAIPGSALVALGLQTVLFGFFISILGLRKK